MLKDRGLLGAGSLSNSTVIVRSSGALLSRDVVCRSTEVKVQMLPVANGLQSVHSHVLKQHGLQTQQGEREREREREKWKWKWKWKWHSYS